MTNLLPCPFCGGKPRPAEGLNEHWISCMSCQASSVMRGNVAASVAAWNARIQPQRMPVALDCLEFMPLTLKPLENPNHDPGEHWALDSQTAYVFKLGCDRERAGRIIATLNAAYALTRPKCGADK